jgi:hypothetical protein
MGERQTPFRHRQWRIKVANYWCGDAFIARDAWWMALCCIAALLHCWSCTFLIVCFLGQTSLDQFAGEASISRWENETEIRAIDFDDFNQS